MPAPVSFVVATLNVHAGVDGWGRPWSVEDAVRSVDADVVVLEEVWKSGDEPSTAEFVASGLGYALFERPLARGRRAHPHPHADHRWMRRLDWRGNSHAIYLDSERPLPRSVCQSQRFSDAERGSWGVAVLSRLPVVEQSVIDLGLPRRDRTRRAALVVRVLVEERPVVVVGTHMTHLTYGSPSHFLRLNRLLGDVVGADPAVLAGDMNLWGPPSALLLRGWRRAVTGATWPAWRPHSQIDHIFVNGSLTVVDGSVTPAFGSDHRGLKARLSLG
jgi:endonuclease/exonuclease/phosphatase family metal-dependent hydrolase